MPIEPPLPPAGASAASRVEPTENNFKALVIQVPAVPNMGYICIYMCV